MKKMGEVILFMVVVLVWLAGAVLAQGWWKLRSVCFPFYSFYLVVERIMQNVGLVP